MRLMKNNVLSLRKCENTTEWKIFSIEIVSRDMTTSRDVIKLEKRFKEKYTLIKKYRVIEEKGIEFYSLGQCNWWQWHEGSHLE